MLGFLSIGFVNEADHALQIGTEVFASVEILSVQSCFFGIMQNGANLAADSTGDAHFIVDYHPGDALLPGSALQASLVRVGSESLVGDDAASDRQNTQHSIQVFA